MPVEDDLFGRLFQQSKFTYSFCHIWLREAFGRLAEKHDVLPEHFVTWANRHELFTDLSLLLGGVRAYLLRLPVIGGQLLPGLLWSLSGRQQLSATHGRSASKAGRAS